MIAISLSVSERVTLLDWLISCWFFYFFEGTNYSLKGDIISASDDTDVMGQNLVSCEVL